MVCILFCAIVAVDKSKQNESKTLCFDKNRLKMNCMRKDNEQLYIPVMKP